MGQALALHDTTLKNAALTKHDKDISTSIGCISFRG